MVIFIFCCNQSATIESNDAMVLLNNVDYYFLDVRTIKEHETKSIPKTDCIPLQELEQRIEELNKHRKRTVIVYCRSGNRSSTAVKILNKKVGDYKKNKTVNNKLNMSFSKSFFKDFSNFYIENLATKHKLIRNYNEIEKFLLDSEPMS